MVRGSTKHTTREPSWVATFVVGGRVSGVDGRSILRARGLVPAYGLLSRGQVGSSEIRLILWVCSRGRDYHEGVVGGMGRVLELLEDSLGHQTFLGTEDAVLANSGSSEGAQGSKLGGLGDKC